MPEEMIVRVAVDVALPAIDRLYDYTVPNELRGEINCGVRVSVPFGRGNRREEGIILAVTDTSDYKKLKQIDSVLDRTPVLSEEMLKLAVHMRERLNCTFYAIVRSMLPAGLWFRREIRYALSVQPADEGPFMEPELRQLSAYFAEHPAPIPERKLRAVLGADCDVQALLRRGVVRRVEDFRPAASEKTDFVYFLTEMGVSAMSGGECTLKGPVRCEVLAFLAHTERAGLNEIEYYTGASRTTVVSLFKDGYLGREERRILRRPETDVYMGTPAVLNEEQKQVADGVSALLDAQTYAPALLFGVTGSGKTEVYIKLIDHALKKRRGVIVLVPEIALTPQMTARFYHDFGDEIAVMHSGLSVGERYDEWQRIRRGEVHVVVGTRSAVFAPVADLGMIIIDEEHEHTFRSENDPRYHARDVAKYRCREAGAVLLLGSATPSVDSAYAAKSGEYAYFELPHRAVPAGLPQVVVSDRRESYRAGYRGCLGMELTEMLAQTLDNHEQAILFLNRRGASRSLSCMACGHVPQCVNCSTALAYHRENGRLLCHQCGYSIRAPQECPACGSPYLEPVGFGTQALEEELRIRFPDARVLRMDSDTTSGRGAHMELLGTFAAGEADILIGTQMIAKGLNFPNVTLSAVVDADMSLYTGDFRSAERTFSLITQVAGRAGRAEKPGFAVIQTLSPQNDVIEAAANQDYWAFYENEIVLRKALNQPPFCRMVLLTLSSPLEDEARQAARRLAARIRSLLGGPYADLDAQLLGPAEAPIYKLNNRYRYTLTLRCRDSRRQRAFLTGILLEFARDRANRSVMVYSDINL
ncbi:MAG: primosomal protein N' [Clostridiaceae bacterium]|nr:primosomal protein N' [Clostridiaceae bacterium]